MCKGPAFSPRRFSSRSIQARAAPMNHIVEASSSTSQLRFRIGTRRRLARARNQCPAAVEDPMPGYAPITPLVLIAALPTPAVAQDADEWSIEESRAPSTTPLRFTATEGTWISLDVSPDGRMACGLNRGRKSSNCIQDCTICASCRWTGSRWTAPRKRKNGFEWRESQTSVASRLCRLAPEGHPRCSSPDGRPAAPRRNAIQNARGYGDTRLPSGISRPIPNKRWPGKVTPPVRQWQSGTRPYTTPSIAFSEGRGGVARGLCGKRMPPSSPRVRVVAFRLAGVFFEPDDQ